MHVRLLNQETGNAGSLGSVAVHALRLLVGNAVVCGEGGWRLHDMQGCSTLGDRGQGAHERASGEHCDGGPAQSQLTLLSHAGCPVRVNGTVERLWSLRIIQRDHVIILEVTAYIFTLYFINQAKQNVRCMDNKPK